MRHGTTVWNEKKIIQGRSNNKLSSYGKELTKERALEFANTNFDIIYSSPLMRTMQTANLMNKFHKVKIIKDERLNELDQGIFVKRLKTTLTEKEKQQRAKRDKSCGMESYKQVVDRASSFLRDLKNSNYENILIITHNAVASFLGQLISGKQIDFANCYSTFNFNNAEIRKFVL